MKNFLDIDDQIELNQKVLDFYYSSYQRTQSKISILVLIYSVIAIYVLQITKYPFDTFPEADWAIIISYSIIFLGFLTLLTISTWNTYLLLKPIDVAYLHYPNYYYNEIKFQYEESLNTDDENILNAYVKATYLNEMEGAVKHNSDLFEIKSKYYNYAFKSALGAVLTYLLCIGFIVFKDEQPQEFNLKNYKEIITEIDSIKTINNNLIIMSDNKETPKDSGKVKIDPSKVIKTKPKMIRENFSNKKTDSSNSESSKKNNE